MKKAKSSAKAAPARPPIVPVPFALLYVAFAILILLAARGDLWLDEIWSLNFARSARSLGDLFTRFRHDNNHPLNTLFLYAVRNQSAFLVDRLLAVLSGIGTLVLVGEHTRRTWSAWAGALSVILVGASYPLLLYFSEARGYAPAICFAVLAYILLDRNLLQFRARRLLLFWLASALGILSHTTFAFAAIAFFIMHLAFVLRPGARPARRAASFLAHQVPAFALLAGWYFLFVRHMEIGGGPVQKKLDVAAQAAAYLLGLPAAGPAALAALAATLLIIVAGVWPLLRHRKNEAIFYLGVLLPAPILLLAIARPKYLYFRYFIICFPFFYMLLSYVVWNAWMSWRRSLRWLPVLAVVCILVGQAARIDPLLKTGRGQYAAAWARIAKETPTPEVTVGSDHDFRNRMVLVFYASRSSQGKLLYYLPQADWKNSPPQWVLVTQGEQYPDPPDELPLQGAGSYRFVAEYGSASVSGWGWFLYRKE